MCTHVQIKEGKWSKEAVTAWEGPDVYKGRQLIVQALDSFFLAFSVIAVAGLSLSSRLELGAAPRSVVGMR